MAKVEVHLDQKLEQIFAQIIREKLSDFPWENKEESGHGFKTRTCHKKDY